MDFWKMNGAGNDFIILNNLKERVPEDEFPRIARILCERRRSIGADGLMVVDAPASGGDFRMRFYNADGTLGEMCGNGARCVCRYGYETGLSGTRQRIETTAGPVTGERVDRRNYRVRLNDPSTVDLDRVLDVSGENIACAYVELGNPGLPHAVVAVPDLREANERSLFSLGRAIRWNASFPKGANVNFYEITGSNAFYMRTFERGVEDFTYACGTGAASTAAVLTLRGLASGENVRADMVGGTLFIDVERQDGRVSGLYLTGPTNIVAIGEVRDETLFPSDSD